MLPKTWVGWTILILVIAVLIWGPAEAGTHLMHGAHRVVTGVQSFFAGIGSG